MAKTTVVQRFSGQIVVAALVVAVAALAVAIWAVRHVGPDAEKATVVAAEQSGQGKTRVCDAFNLVRNAVTLQTNTDLGADPVALQAVAANARLATLGGGQLLLSRLDGDVSKDLADAVRSFANNLEDIGISQLAGERVEDAAQAARANDAQAAATRIDELCK